MARTRYEIRLDDVEEATFDDRDQANLWLDELDDGTTPITLVKITETVVASRHK